MAKVKAKRMIETDHDKCLRCGGCVAVCPVSALNLTEHGITCSERCIDCRACIGFCPVGAIKQVKRMIERRR